jgi:hypothetical protein
LRFPSAYRKPFGNSQPSRICREEKAAAPRSARVKKVKNSAAVIPLAVPLLAVIISPFRIHALCHDRYSFVQFFQPISGFGHQSFTLIPAPIIPTAVCVRLLPQFSD